MAPGTDRNEPVTGVNWRHAMVWCNALTEWHNRKKGTNYACVYTSDAANTIPIRTALDSTTIRWDEGSTYSGTDDEPYINSSAKGFRLPGALEWECAARYKDGTDWTAGSWASGAAADYLNDAESLAVAVFGVIWDGGNYTETGVTSTADVKSKAPNLLGIYDMSGNVYEWCFDWYPPGNSLRVMRGTGWEDCFESIQVGLVDAAEPYYVSNDTGIRFVRNQ